MKRILLVDDEPYTGEIIRYFIQEHDLPLEIVGEADRGDRALELIRQLRPEIVFLDIQMPVLNGLQVMEIARRDESLSAVFIIITAYDYFEYAQKALQLGAKDLLLKPLQYRQFDEALQRVLGYRYSDNPLFNQLLEYIQNHYTEEIDLGDCAARLCTTPNNIARLFRKHMNTKFTTYYNRLRITRAQELLVQGVPIKEAAVQVGYNNLNYFYRNFKSITGVTPKEFISSR